MCNISVVRLADVLHRSYVLLIYYTIIISYSLLYVNRLNIKLITFYLMHKIYGIISLLFEFIKGAVTPCPAFVECPERKECVLTLRLHNAVVKDYRLKLQDIGLIAILQLHDVKFFSEYKLSQLVPTHGRTSLRSSIKRLEKFGYLERIHHHDDNGRLSQCEWKLCTIPHSRRKYE